MATASKRTAASSKILKAQTAAAAKRCSLSEDIQLSVHGAACEMARPTRYSKHPAKRPLSTPEERSRRHESAKAKKERLAQMALRAARAEHEHSAVKREVLVVASDIEEAVERAISEATAGDWRLRASVPKKAGEYTGVTAQTDSRWLVTVMVKRPAPTADAWSNWH